MGTLINIMQMAVAVMSGVTLIAWMPAAARIWTDWARGNSQIVLEVPLWRIGIAALSGVSAGLIGFAVVIVTGKIYNMGFLSGHAPTIVNVTTLIALALFYMMLMWFSSYGKLSRRALRDGVPAPWTDKHLDWKHVQYVGGIVLLMSSILVGAT